MDNRNIVTVKEKEANHERDTEADQGHRQRKRKVQKHLIKESDLIIINYVQQNDRVKQ